MLTLKDFLDKATKIHGNLFDYSLLTDRLYKSHEKISIKCKKHNIFSPEVREHLRGRGCGKCYRENKKGKIIKTKEYYLDLSEKIHSKKYTYDNFIYSGAYYKSYVTCSIHGDFLQNMNNHTNKTHARGCPKCGLEINAKNNILSQADYIKKCEEVHQDTYDLSEIIYVKAHQKITPICKKHGKWTVKAYSFVLGIGCPSCNESKGEKIINKILKGKNIYFLRQHTYDNCKGKKYNLKFDFFIPYNNTIIEYDGEQHFYPMRWADKEKSIKNLQYIKNNDNIKNSYCKINNINLLRIPYTMKHEEIVNSINLLFYELECNGSICSEHHTN